MVSPTASAPRIEGAVGDRLVAGNAGLFRWEGAAGAGIRASVGWSEWAKIASSARAGRYHMGMRLVTRLSERAAQRYRQRPRQPAK